jgi:hypothetical protein
MADKKDAKPVRVGMPVMVQQGNSKALGICLSINARFSANSQNPEVVSEVEVRLLAIQHAGKEFFLPFEVGEHGVYEEKEVTAI